MERGAYPKHHPQPITCDSCDFSCQPDFSGFRSEDEEVDWCRKCERESECLLKDHAWQCVACMGRSCGVVAHQRQYIDSSGRLVCDPENMTLICGTRVCAGYTDMCSESNMARAHRERAQSEGICLDDRSMTDCLWLNSMRQKNMTIQKDPFHFQLECGTTEGRRRCPQSCCCGDETCIKEGP